MTDSLIVGGYELIGAATNPEYRLAPDWDFGEGEPDTVTIASQFLDGDAVVGTRTSNRTPKLPVMVFGTSRLDLSTKINLLRLALSSGPWTGQWTPDAGLPALLDAYRAKVIRKRDCVRDAMFSADVEITCPALPFMRSPDQQSVTIAGQTQLVNFDTIQTGTTLDTTNKYEGTGSAALAMTRTLIAGAYYQYQPASSAAPSGTFAAKNLSADAAVSAQFRWVAPTGVAGTSTTWSLRAYLTLSSAAGSITLIPSGGIGFLTGDTTWHSFTYSLVDPAAIASSTGTFDVTAVTGYSFNIFSSSASSFAKIPTANTVVNVDDLRALPAASAQTTTARGSVLVVPAVLGSARTPVSIAATGTINAFLAHRPPSSQDANLQILTGVTVAASPSHPAASTITAVNGRFAGTYSAVLGVSTVGAAGANTVTVTVTQLANGASVASQVLTVTYTSPQSDRLVKLGEITLPLRAVTADNTTTTYTIDINHTAGADAYSDFMLLDTSGQTVIADPPNAAVGAVYLDEPSTLTTLGNIYASALGNRTDTYGILDTALISGGPFVFDPGNNRMLIWSDTAAPTLTVTYYPRWLDERVA